MLSVIKPPQPEPLIWPSDAIAAQICDTGWWCGTAQLHPTALNALRLASTSALAKDSFLAGVGRQFDHRIDSTVRGDRIAWLEPGNHEIFDLWFHKLHALSKELRPLLRLPLHGVEAMCACYPPGAAYERHVDQHRDLNARLLYLNPNWQSGDGGELNLWTNSQPEQQLQIEPRFGTFILFRSDLPHAVRTALKPRYSITAWLRRDELV